MAGVPEIRTFRRMTLAFGLCLLAFCFAMEAKLVPYSAAHGSESDIAAAKAWPADLPQVVAHGIQGLNRIHTPALVLFVASFASASFEKAEVLRGSNLLCSRLSVFSAAYFSPHLFFRPPPVR